MYDGNRNSETDWGTITDHLPVMTMLDSNHHHDPRSASGLAATAASSPEQLLREMLGAFDGKIQPVRRPSLYRMTVAVAALVTALLPLGYGVLIVSAGFGLWHVLSVLFAAFQGSVWLAGMTVVFLLLSVVLLLITLKPLLARPSRRKRNRTLQFGEEPLLFSFIKQLCLAVDAPQPTTVEVNLAPNSAAELQCGFKGLVHKRLVLTIGLTFVAGMNVQSFAGILAHELGHFSQGAGMRLNHLIQSVNGWFERVVYQDDIWDERLYLFRGSENIAVVSVGHLLAVIVLLIRRVLWVLMMLGRLLNGCLLRQMELDADRYAARLAGSDIFKPTTRRAIELAVADALAHEILLVKWQRTGFPENLSTFTARIADALPDESRQKVDELLERRETKPFDTHPAPRERVCSVEREPADGIFRWDLPASRLFADFDRLAAELAYETYQAAFGPLMSQDQLLPLDTFWERMEMETSSGQHSPKMSCEDDA